MKEIEILFKNFLLRLLLLFSGSRKSSNTPVFDESSKLLFIRLNRIGDALVTTPLLALAKDSLRSQVYVLADRKNHFVFSNNPSVDRVIVFEKGIKGFRELLKLIRNERFDAIIDLHDDVSTTVTFLIALADCPNKLGLDKENRVVYTKTVKRPDAASTHVVDRMLAVGTLLGLDRGYSGLNICYKPLEYSVSKAEHVLSKKFPKRRFLIGVNISAGSEARFWGVENFRSTLRLLEQYDADVLVLCVTSDLKHALAITDNNRDRIFYSPSFDEFAAMISKLDMLITPDTSVVHLASSFNVPVFGLYVKYNTNDMIWSPYCSEFDYVVTEKHFLAGISFEETQQKLRPFIDRFCKSGTIAKV